MPPKKKIPIDPLNGARMVLQGRVVTMDSKFKVLPRGRLYINEGSIVSVLASDAPVPAGFDTVAVLDTKGTLYPGLIELHNHLAYNALSLWKVPKLYKNRDQWAGIPEYRKLISGPMQVIGKSPEVLPALARYVEAKCLLSGVTTSQGIALYSNAGARKFYRGVIRNVEQTDEPDLPEAMTRIPDVDAADIKKFKNRLLKQSCFLLHLSEGKDDKSRNAFQALKMSADEWAITPALAGIHCAGLQAEDFDTLAQFGGSMVWSPLSNLLLYGDTALIKAAKSAGVRIGLGSDWSPSGSKNLLGELKAAKLWSDEHNIFSDRELVAMATRSGAGIVGWQERLGSLQAGKRADVLVLPGSSQDPYSQLIAATESDIALVMINGVPRCGLPAWMKNLGVKAADGESWEVGGKARTLFLKQETQDPSVANLSLAPAVKQLAKAFKELPKLAKKVEQPKSPTALSRGKTTWMLALDELEDTGAHLRPHLPFAHLHTGPKPMLGKGSKKLSEVVTPMGLDPLTVADDADFIDRIEAQGNLPEVVRSGLRDFY